MAILGLTGPIMSLDGMEHTNVWAAVSQVYTRIYLRASQAGDSFAEVALEYYHSKEFCDAGFLPLLVDGQAGPKSSYRFTVGGEHPFESIFAPVDQSQSDLLYNHLLSTPDFSGWTAVTNP